MSDVQAQGLEAMTSRCLQIRVFAFHYTHSRKVDHLALCRPGTGTTWILQNIAGVFKSGVCSKDAGRGIGGYDLRSPADRATAFDYNSSGKKDHVVLRRPGTGTVWILQNNQGLFFPINRTGDPGSGIGGYHLKSPDDRAFALGFSGSGMANDLAFYRPGTGTLWILVNVQGNFRSVFAEGNPGKEGEPCSGISGYDLLSPRDRALSFDFTGSGKGDCVALYRPGAATSWILQRK